MENCIFCKIINGELPSKTIYEDTLIKVIMNIDPSTDGHLLVIPKKHLVTIKDIDDELILHIINTVKNNLYPMLEEKLNCKGLTLAQNNGLGQEIKHFHLHLIPRYDNDKAEIEYDKSNLSSLDAIYEKLK